MTVLESLLDAGVHLDAEYGDGLASHLPMTLVALHALGATDARLQAFATAYARKLGAAPPAEDWPAGDAWQSRLGQPAAWPMYRSLFALWLLHEGPDAVLAQVLPVLFRGSGAAAFHGLIRTAYGVLAGHPGELADGLAYWACRHLELPRGDGAGDGAADEADPALVLGSQWQALAGWRSAERLIVQRMRHAVLQPAVGAHEARLRVDAATLGKLARLALRLYARSGDFSVLHLVTGCHAMQVLLPFVDAPLAAVRDFWTAYAAAAATVVPPARSAVKPARLEWPEIVARALASDDEHAIKLVCACRELERVHGWDDCRAAAARGVVTAA